MANPLRTRAAGAYPPAATVSLFADGAVEVLAAPLDVDAAAVRVLAQLLSDAERERAGRFIFDRDRRRFTVARARLRQILAARLHVEPQEVEFAYGPQGKPALARRFAASALTFNLSHSEDLAVYAIAGGGEVGVDVEAVRALRDADEIAARFFSRSENEAYLALAARDRPLGFFNCWTRKEAFINALGEGLSHPLDSFDVSLAPGEPARLLRVGDPQGEPCGWALHSFPPRPGFVGAIALRSHA